MQTPINKSYHALWFVLATFCWLMCSCTANKYLKEGQSFYDGAEIRFNMPQGPIRRKATIEAELQSLIVPKPNKKFIGSRPGVWFYYVAGEPKKKKGGLRNFIRNKLGKQPVFLSDVTPGRTASLLQGQLRNDGYFFSTVEHKTEKNETSGKVIYDVELYKAYRYRNIAYPQPKDTTYAMIIRDLYETSLLDSNQRYDLERMQAEKDRIERELEGKGFYYFDDRYLIFEADSTVGKRRVDLWLTLKPNIPDRAKRIYRLNSVNAYPNYTITADTVQKLDTASVLVNGVNYVDNIGKFRPEVITRVINLKKGHIYSREEQELTLSHLMDLGTFKYVNVKFNEAPREDSAMLDSHIYLTPLKKMSLRADLQGLSKSNNFVGPGITLTYTNRNIFRGAELFQLKLHSAYEVQYSRKVEGPPLNSFEIGAEAKLTVPRFIAPIRIDYSSRKYLPKTQMLTSFNQQNRVGYFRLRSFNMGYGYTWRESAQKSHELFPIDINFVQLDRKSDAFDTLLARNATLANSFENQFIVGTRYSYTINTQLTEAFGEKYKEVVLRPHNFYLNATTDVAGNLLHSVQRLVNKGENEPYQLLGAPYSRFIRGQVDFRHYWQLDEHNKLVSRIVVGAGRAFGTYTDEDGRVRDQQMPYIKQFSIGGSNSIRAFPARSIGPGTYSVFDDDSVQSARFFIDQRADIKMEVNVEYRFDIIKALKGALFADAGNIWLNQEEASRPGGKFQGSKFLNQFAVGTGAGLRFDFSFFVLRCDIAFPIRKSVFINPDDRTMSERTFKWVFNEIDLGSSRWRSDNLVVNIAIGYPF